VSDKDQNNDIPENEVIDENQSVEVSDDSIEIEADISPIEVLEEEVGQLKDQMLRVQAEAANTRRRAEIDVQNAHKFGQEKLIKDLLLVADNLERGLKAIDQDDEAMKAVVEGIELTHKSLVDTLKKHQCEAIDPTGEPFDPQNHQAMAMVPNPDVEPNTVIDVMQKGYILHGRVIRPAMVVVSKEAE